MFLEILAIVIVLASALLHFKAGAWAGVMSLWTVIVSGAVAFGFYLPVSRLMVSNPDPVSKSYYWADGLALLILFIVSLGLLRLLMGAQLRRRMSLPDLIDGALGAVGGVVAGYFAAGVVVVVAQMMPMPPSVLGYQPFGFDGRDREQRMSLRYDDAVLGMYSGLSRGALSTDEAGLPGRYPNRYPENALAVASTAVRDNPYRGRNSDDILYEYFRRRVALTFLDQEGKGPMSSSAGIGAALIAGQSVQDNLRIKIEGARIVPAIISPQIDRDERTAISPADLKWLDQSGGQMEAEAERHDLLLVDVTFQPETDASMDVPLANFKLSSNLVKPEPTARREQRYFFEHARPKLIGVGTWSNLESRFQLPPTVGEHVIDGSVTYQRPEDFSGLRDGQELFFVADSAVWRFPPASDRSQVRTTLVFLVPHLSQPWNYALRYSSDDVVAGTSSSEPPQGLMPKAVATLGQLELTVDKADRMPRLNQFDLSSGSDEEFFVVEARIENKGNAPIGLGSEDLQLKAKGQGDAFRVSLLNDELDFTDDADALKGYVYHDSSKRQFVRLGQEIEAKHDKDKKKMALLSADWQMVLTKGATAKVQFVSQVKRGTNFRDVAWSLAGDLPETAPEWYLQLDSRQARSSSHGLRVSKVQVLPEVTIGTRVMKTDAGVGGQYVLVQLLFSPSKSDDRSYYYVEPGQVKVLAEGKSANAIAPLSVRLKGQEVFEKSIPPRVILQGEQTVDLLYYLVSRSDADEVKVDSFSSQKLPPAE